VLAVSGLVIKYLIYLLDESDLRDFSSVEIKRQICDSS